ncbi:MAG TPA: hypothetical protein DCO68_04835 [Methylophilaceae bacterium]|nr:hypothetical protein [Methylophilaceae bacterium]
MSIKVRQTLLLGLVAATASLPALADDEYQDRARVLSVTPQVQRVNTPTQECRTEYVRERVYENRERSNTGAIVGGIAGGLLGSRFGGGSGRIATAVVGAGLGAIVGDRVDNDRRGNNDHCERVVTRPVERCVTVDHWSEVTTGYLVSYEYNGRQYTTVTDSDPGRFITVNVAVRENGYVSDVAYRPERWDDHDNGRGYGHRKHRHHDYW